MSRFPSKDAARWYLAGVFDGEGSVTDPDRWRPHVQIGNTDQDILDAVYEALELLGIRYGVSTKVYESDNHRDFTSIMIAQRDALDVFEKLVPAQCRMKRDRLVRGNRRPRLTRIDPPWERIDAMIAAGLSRREMADSIGVKYETFCGWLRRRVSNAA